MPTNKKEGIFFTTVMCFSMVFVMSAYNLVLHDDLHWSSLLLGLLPGFIVAFILDVFVVGTVAKKVAFSLPINKDSKMQLIIAISSCMVLGMVTFMSLFGVVMENGFTLDNLGANYVSAWGHNIIMALPLQLLVVGPFARKMLDLFQQANTETATADSEE